MKANNTNIALSTLIPSLQQRGAVVLLESQSYAHPAAQKTYLAALPQAEIIAYGSKVYTRKDDVLEESSNANPWEELTEFRAQTDGWLFGYLGYDLKNYIEKLNSNNFDQIQAPDLYMMNPGLLIEINPQSWSVLKGEIPSEQYSNNGFPIMPNYTTGDLLPHITEEVYCGIIQKAKDDIREGQYYEINLSHQMKENFSGEPFGLYQDMKQAGPVPFGAYIHFEDQQDEFGICSASPERFLAKQGNRVYSQPIKGTIHRGATGPEDQRLKRWLSDSEKNRAENLMIVDLVRNDLGKVAQKGSVNVSDLFEVQTFETVHQMVSTVEAKVSNRDPVEIIKACFPMGSMTGAPKISAMRAIEKYEDYRRGIYSGAIGYMTPEEDFDFNVVIRTAIIKDDQLYYSVGGAITSDSEPKEEWLETQVKAKALTAAVSGNRKNRLYFDSNAVK